MSTSTWSKAGTPATANNSVSTTMLSPIKRVNFQRLRRCHRQPEPHVRTTPETSEADRTARPDGLVFGNTGNPLDLKPGYEHPAIPAFQDFLDGDTIERYVCQLDTSGNTLRPPASKWGGDPSLSWDDLGRKLQAYLGQGKPILVTSDIGIGNGGEDSPVRRLPLRCRRPHSGVTWIGLCSPSQIAMSDPRVADLYHVRLGEAQTEELTDSSSGINFRVFTHGLAAVNWGQSEAALTVRPPIPATLFYDMFSYSPSGSPSLPNTTVLSIPANAGRVYLFGSGTDFGLDHLITSL